MRASKQVLAVLGFLALGSCVMVAVYVLRTSTGLTAQEPFQEFAIDAQLHPPDIRRDLIAYQDHVMKECVEHALSACIRPHCFHPRTHTHTHTHSLTHTHTPSLS